MINFPVAFIALVFERFFPFWDFLGKNNRHPIIWLGNLISFLEQRLNKENKSPRQRRRAGVFMLVILLVVTLIISVFLLWLIRFLPFPWVFEALLASILLAYRGLHKAVSDVATSLDISTEAAREQVGHIVGRDTKNLDEHEISRAAIESLAENSSDGVIAPLFWLVIFGLPGIAIYKAINTADSMVGHLNERYTDFGWASAKLDDLANLYPARLTAVLYALAAGFVTPNSKNIAKVAEITKITWQSAKTDAPNHTSPNAGWPEAAMAGALGFSLGGPRDYAGKTLDLPRMGQGRRDLKSMEIFLALRLFAAMATIALLLIGVLALTQFLLL